MTRREAIARKVLDIRHILALVPGSREKSLMLTKLDEACLWMTQVPDQKELDAEANDAT
jgi:hypothetical protein